MRLWCLWDNMMSSLYMLVSMSQWYTQITRRQKCVFYGRQLLNYELFSMTRLKMKLTVQASLTDTGLSWIIGENKIYKWLFCLFCSNKINKTCEIKSLAIAIKWKYFNMMQCIWTVSYLRLKSGTVSWQSAQSCCFSRSLTVLPYVCVGVLRVLGLQLTVPGSTC